MPETKINCKAVLTHVKEFEMYLTVEEEKGREWLCNIEIQNNTL